jgi:hypothetical protein
VTERHGGLPDEQRDDLLDDVDDVDEDDEEGAEPIGETHPGFTIVCDECGSELVVVENDLEFSVLAGRQGNVYLRCTDCDAETFLLPPTDEPDEDDNEDEE